MKTQDSPFWVTITMESEEAEEKVRQAIKACNQVHEWTLEALTTQWLIDSGYRVRTADLMPKLTPILESHGIKETAQRFSYTATVSRAIARFYSNLFVDGVGYGRAEVVFPDHKPPSCYQVLDIQHRNVWKKYMEQHQRISTHYGSIFLEGEWTQTMLDQSLSLRISPSVAPYLMYSVTVKETEGGWRAHFNFHEPDSFHGKKRNKRLWKKQTEARFTSMHQRIEE